EDAEAVRADDARVAQPGELDHLRHLGARDALGHDHDQLDTGLDRLEDGVASEPGWDRDDGAVDVRPLRDLPHAVIDGHAVDVPALPARGHAADDPAAVVEALAGQVHGLPAGDALHDEGRLAPDEDRHRREGAGNTPRRAGSRTSDVRRDAVSPGGGY